MKKLYSVGTAQFFSYTTYSGMFSKNKELKIEKYWVLRNKKFIYAESVKVAEEKYSAWFKKTYTGVTRSWGDWDIWSDGVGYDMDEDCIEILSEELFTSEKIDVNIEELKKNMQAENFREWWFGENYEQKREKEII